MERRPTDRLSSMFEFGSGKIDLVRNLITDISHVIVEEYKDHGVHLSTSYIEDLLSRRYLK